MANEKLTLTEKEEMVLKAIIKESNFDSTRLDITKSWEEQRVRDYFWAFADTKDYGCGMSKQTVRGIFGSLVKKGLISLSDDDDITWIVIGKEEFENIKACLR